MQLYTVYDVGKRLLKRYFIGFKKHIEVNTVAEYISSLHEVMAENKNHKDTFSSSLLINNSIKDLD